MEIKILHGLKGADEAKGIVVVIDVFRAFTVEAVMIAKGAKHVIPVGSIEDTHALKSVYNDAILVGERHGHILPGFDVGNSPSQLAEMELANKTLLHTTSAGTQGIIHAKNAERIFTGALINAQATASYIRSLNPNTVSLVALGLMGTDQTPEDELCALYLKSLLENNPMPDIVQRADDLRYSEGKKFFDPKQQESFPKADFAWCVTPDRYDFAVEIVLRNDHYEAVRIDV